MADYLDVDGFKARTLAPATYVDEVEAIESGWTLEQLSIWSAWIDSQLRKRYAVPFATPYPDAILVWLSDIVTERLYLKRGVDASDRQIGEIKDLAAKAREDIQQAADAANGLFELPLKQDVTATGVSKGAPLAYHEAGPYAWPVSQRSDADSDTER